MGRLGLEEHGDKEASVLGEKGLETSNPST